MRFTLKTFEEFYTKNLPTKSSFPSAVFLHRGETSWGPDTLKRNRAKPYWNRSNRWGKLRFVWWLGWWSKNGLDLGDCWKLGWIFFHVFGDVFFVCIFVVVFVFIISGRGYPVGDKVSSAGFFFPEGVWCKSKVLVFQDVKLFLTLQQQNRWRENRNLSLVSLEECSKIKWF